MAFWKGIFHSGTVSDKLRKSQSTDQILKNPRKSDSKPMPKSGVEGIQISKPGRKGQKK